MTLTSPKKSTTVRFSSQAALRLLRPLFGVLEAAAPGLGGRLAVRVWCTIPRHRSGAAAADRPPGGAVFRVPAAGRPVVAEAWGAGPIVYLVHGWGGHRGQLDAFVGPLVAAGYRVVSFDALGHGDSAPGAVGARQSTLPEMAETLTAVVAAVGPAHGIVAHSIGGTATAFAVLDGLAADRLVLIAPLADPIRYTGDFAAAVGFGDRVHGRFRRGVEALIGRPLTDLDVASRAAGSPAALPALLVVHDTDDKEARHADGRTLAAAWPGAELAVTRGLGHRRILRDAGVAGRAVAFLAAP